MPSLKSILKDIYPNKYQQVLKNLPKSKTIKNNHWHKSINLYVTYADSFKEGKKADLSTLTKNLNKIKTLGCNAIHVLPFLESPQIDAGFDISDYMNIDKKFGGNKEFNPFLKAAKKSKIKIFMDIVLNHCSDQHEWFKKATLGNQKYRNYFLHSKEKPILLKRWTDKFGPLARYRFDKKEVDIRIIFPEQAGKIPHFEKAKDGYWYYHTFYPCQIDLDWRNPDVFSEFSKILMHWAKKGVNFRLDAIPFVGKNIWKGKLESTKKTYAIVQALNKIVKLASPDSVFLVEACQQLKQIKKYFGKNEITSELAYNFDLMQTMWFSIITKKNVQLWDILKHTSNVPKYAQWITFLRSHDELMFEFLSKKSRTKIFKELLKNGMSFKQGFGIAGRTASFLGNDTNRISMAYALLASLPGSPAIIYGDEYGKTNDFSNLKKQLKIKQKISKDKSVKEDARDINRGIIDQQLINNKNSRIIFENISKIMNTRQKYSKFFLTKPKQIKINEKVFAAEYKYRTQKLRVYVNLSDKKIKLQKEIKENIVLHVNSTEDHLKLDAHEVLWTLK